MPNIQMQKAGARVPVIYHQIMPVADPERQPSPANDALQKSVHPITVCYHKQNALIHINQPPQHTTPPNPYPPKNSPLQPTTGRAAKAAGGFYA